MLKNSKRFYKVLSAGLLAGIIMMGTAVNTFAQVQSIVIYDSSSDVNYEYNMAELLQARKLQERGGESALYKDFNKLLMDEDNKIISYYDDKNEYIDYESVLKAYTTAVRRSKKFDFHSFAESDEVEKIAIETELKKEVDGEIVVERNIKNDFRIVGIE